MGSLNYASPIPQRRGFRLPFEIVIVSNTPLTPLKDIDDVALLFLTQIGYIPKGYDPKTDASSVRDSVPYRLFVECLLGRLDKGWTVEQLAAKLKTTKATIYRHINKLKEMDLLDEEVHLLQLVDVTIDRRFCRLQLRGELLHGPPLVETTEQTLNEQTVWDGIAHGARV